MPYKNKEDRLAYQRKYNKEHRDKQSEYWKNNPDKLRRYNNEYHKKRKAAIAAIKRVPCMDCGQLFPSCCMEFDHRNPSEKLFGISQQCKRNWDELLTEMAKCDIVCSNCHRIRHFGKYEELK